MIAFNRKRQFMVYIQGPYVYEAGLYRVQRYLLMFHDSFTKYLILTRCFISIAFSSKVASVHLRHWNLVGSGGGVTRDFSTPSMGGVDVGAGWVWETLVIILIRSETLDSAFF